jgi:L-threonylcarbamoyladenylate synthase
LAAGWLREGALVGVPTETVYGLAANALDPDAVLQVFLAKGRPAFNPLIVHVDAWDSARSYVRDIPEVAARLAERFLPGPLTLLLPKKEVVPDLVTAGSDRVALRVPAHPMLRELLTMLDFPLAAPSANPFGYVSPTCADHVRQGLGGRIPYILDGGACLVGLESTIVEVSDGIVWIRRNGGIPVGAIAEVAAGLEVRLATRTEDHPVAPGQLKSHYATTTPLFVGPPPILSDRFSGRRICVIDHGPAVSVPDAWCRFQLSADGTTEAMARNLFAVMRQADSCGADVILTDWVDPAGLGAAINDRLERACSQSDPTGGANAGIP